MRAANWTTCWWPGLTALWLRGRWVGLAVAVAFGCMVQFALLQTFAPALMPTYLAATVSPAVAWVCVLSLWVMGVWFSSRTAMPQSLQDPQFDQWLHEAQVEYLKGHWIEAESVLARLLARKPDDAEALLLKATIQRRTRRPAAAQRTLEELADRPPAAPWAWEIRSEVQRIANSQRMDNNGEIEESQQTSRAA